MGSGLSVLIPSVHWRRAGLARVIADLARQDVAPECVHLFLDSWGTERPTIPVGLRVAMHENLSGQGAWARWFFIDRFSPDQLVATMDDDMTVAPSYVGRAVEWAQKFKGSILSWGGHDDRHQCVFYTRAYDETVPLVRAMAGITIFRAGDLQGMTSMPGASELIAKDSPEEALIAAYAWQHSRLLLRPPGASGLDAQPTANDPRCNYHQHRYRWPDYFRRASELTGWPHGPRLATYYGPRRQ